MIKNHFESDDLISRDEKLLSYLLQLIKILVISYKTYLMFIGKLCFCVLQITKHKKIQMQMQLHFKITINSSKHIYAWSNFRKHMKIKTSNKEVFSSYFPIGFYTISKLKIRYTGHWKNVPNKNKKWHSRAKK